MEPTYTSGGAEIWAHTSIPDPPPRRGGRGLLLCHGFPDAAVGASGAPSSYPQLADRICEDLGWIVVTPAFRGCGDSTGDFSLGGWLDDANSGLDHLRTEHGVASVFIAGFGTGGALAVSAAARDGDVRGVAAFAAPADFTDWAENPKQLLEHARAVGAIRDPAFPADYDAWADEFGSIRAVDAAPEIATTSMLVVHGADDGLVPVFDGRIIADAHGEADLRVVAGAGHRLRYDPRVIAMLLGWLARIR